MTEKVMIERKLLVPACPNTQGSGLGSFAAFVIFLFADFVLSNFCDIVKFDLTSVLKKFPIVVCFFSGFVTEKNWFMISYQTKYKFSFSFFNKVSNGNKPIDYSLPYL